MRFSVQDVSLIRSALYGIIVMAHAPESPTHGNYDTSTVRGIDVLKRRLAEIDNSDDPAERADMLADIFLNGHEGATGYVNFGNTKIHKSVGIFNLNSATDCPNAETTKDNPSDTGVCQVPFESCYARKTERDVSPQALDKRRRQEYLWDHIDAWTFADALLRLKERKTAEFSALRFSESGDFRHNQDIVKAETIAKIIDPEITAYTYSASHKLTAWQKVDHLVVNQSNSLADYGDRRFMAMDPDMDTPDGAVRCPFDYDKRENGKSSDEAIKCGECRLCLDKDGPDVVIDLH